MEFNVFLILVIIICIVGLLRFIQLIYIIKKGFISQLEYVNYSHSSENSTGPDSSNAYIGGESTAHYVKAKYRTKSGLYIHKNVPQSVFGINSLEPVDIIVFPNNDKKYILKNKMTQWIIPTICTIVFFITIIAIILSSM